MACAPKCFESICGDDVVIDAKAPQDPVDVVSQHWERIDDKPMEKPHQIMGGLGGTVFSDNVDSTPPAASPRSPPSQQSVESDASEVLAGGLRVHDKVESLIDWGSASGASGSGTVRKGDVGVVLGDAKGKDRGIRVLCGFPNVKSISMHPSQLQKAKDNMFSTEPTPPQNDGKRVMRYRIDEKDVLNKAWWCYYCICGGCGCTEEAAAPHFISKCCCCRQTCEGTDNENHEGMCSFLHICCICISLCQWPPRKDTPVCILCNGFFCGVHGKKKDEPPPRRISDSDEIPHSMFDFAINEKFMLWYCLGCGLSVSTNILEIYESFTKCLCWRCTLGFSPPFAEDGCCAHLVSIQQCHSQCRLPVKIESNPFCAMFGRRARPVPGSNVGVGNLRPPKQLEMR